MTDTPTTTMAAAAGRNIAAHRERLGWTQDELARRLGAYMPTVWFRQQVSNAEQGRRSLPVDELTAIALTLGTTPADLLNPRGQAVSFAGSAVPASLIVGDVERELDAALVKIAAIATAATISVSLR